MATKKDGLQKLTDSEIKINKLFALEKITKADIKDFTKADLKKLSEITTEELKHLTGNERDRYIEKLEGFISDDVKREIWEFNHQAITNAISAFVKEYGRMPLKNQIASSTGLSRQTIHKHLKEFHDHPLFKANLEQFKFTSHLLLSKVLKLALYGDIKAARLYFDVVGKVEQPRSENKAIRQQNNFIQINNTVFSQANIEMLNAEQLSQIESVIKSTLPRN